MQPFREVYEGRGAFASESRPPITTRYVPFARSMSGYSRMRLRTDVVAGVTVAALALPSAMAFAELAGVPVSAGLYALLLPVLAYAVFGSAPRVVVGPEGTVALLVATALAPLAATGSAEYAALAAMLALLVGLVYFVARLARLGWIADYFSQAVLVGYITGVAVVLILGQIGKLVGVSSDEDGAIREAVDIIANLGDANGATVVVGAVALGILVVTSRISKRIPGALIVVVLGIVASWALDLAARGVGVTGPVPSGLPSFAVPDVSRSDIGALTAAAVAIFLVSFSDSILTARSFAARHQEVVDADQELLAFGFTEVAAGMTQGIPVGTSGSRTAVNDDMGATSQISGLAAAGTIAVILLFLTAPIEYLPSAVLGAVIVFAASKLIDLEQWRSLARSSRTEVVIAAITAVFVVTIGVLQAIVVAVVLSIADVIRRAAQPADAVLGWSAEDDRYVDVSDHLDAGVTPGVVVYRIQDRMFFANAHFFKRRLWAAVDGAPKPVRHVILDASFISDIDASAEVALREVIAGLRERNIELHVARATAELQLRFDGVGLSDTIGADHFHAQRSQQPLTPVECHHCLDEGTWQRGGSQRLPVRIVSLFVTGTTAAEHSIAPATGPAQPDLEIVESKLSAPRRRPGTVVRTRLLERLDASSAPIITVVAPAGYGKTTLLGQWSDQHLGRMTWLSLDRQDNEPAALLAYLVASLERIEPVDPQWRRRSLGESAIGVTGAVRLIAAWVSSIRTPFLMIIDQAEAIQHPVSGDLIAAVALNLPAGCRLALASRTEPLLPMARLRSGGLIEEIAQADLALGDEEAQGLLVGAGVTLSDSEVTDLVAHMEGWPVGLYLASLSIRASASRTGPLIPPRGDDRVVADYLRAEVISSLPPSTVGMLIRTSILDRLSGPLCDAVTASAGSQQLLESLEKANTLMIPLDRERSWYRCHHLLGEMLRAELEHTEPEMVSRLHDRASTWFEANGQPSSALDHSQLAGDGDRAALLFCKIGPAFQAAGRTETVGRWLRWFEEQNLIGHYPQVAALGAIFESLNGQRAYSLLLADFAADGDMNSPVPDGGQLGGWVAAMETCLCRRGVDRMRDDAGRAAELLSPWSSLRGPVIVLEALAALIQGDPMAADQLFVTGAELCSRSGSAPSHALALAERSVISLDGGDRSGARVLSEQAVKVVEEHHLEGYVDATLVYAVAARTAAHAGELQDARRYVAASARLRPRCTAAIPWTAQFLVQLAHAYVALGDAAGARAVLRQARDIMLVSPELGVLQQQCAELSELLDAITTGSIGASSLTAAELRLLPLLATHLTHQEIGERLYVSRNTIKSQAMSIYRKLGASTRGEAVRIAEQIGLLGR